MPNTIPKRSNQCATQKQLRYLRFLAEQNGATFITPLDWKDASRQIDRMLKARADSPGDRRRDARAISRELQERPQDATRFRSDETVGYGSSARWA